VNKVVLDSDPVPELVAQLAQEIYKSDLLVLMVQTISKLEFEARKDVTQIFNNLLRRQLGTRFPTVEYICTKEYILHSLIEK
jgi:calcium binding protein 39